MKKLTPGVLHPLWPAGLFCLALPMPEILFWRSHDGRFIALCCFFVGCTVVVVTSFRRNINGAGTVAPPANSKGIAVLWRQRILSTGWVLLVEWAVFSAGLLWGDPKDFIAPALALAALISSLCIAPYYAITLRKPFAATVFTLFSLGCMKLIAGSVNALINGWHADTTLTWTRPNVIVWALLISAAICSLSFYIVGAKKFRALHADPAERGTTPNVVPVQSPSPG